MQNRPPIPSPSSESPTHTGAPDGANPSLYTRATMALRYTPQVIWWRHPMVWGVPNRLIHARYACHTAAEHVEVGPGNGYFLAHLPRWSPLERLHLLDVNPACLTITARRLRGRFPLSAHTQSALEPWDGIPDSAVGSVSCHMTLHAIKRDTMAELAPLAAEARRVLSPSGVFFGSTVLPAGPGVRLTRAARRIIHEYTQAGIFSNSGDTLDGLRGLLTADFAQVRLRVFGCVAVWEAWGVHAS